jgi:hypothetical protein
MSMRSLLHNLLLSVLVVNSHLLSALLILLKAYAFTVESLATWSTIVSLAKLNTATLPLREKPS